MTLALAKIKCNTTNFPFCVVWTPNPKISWFCPIFGHMGIGMSSGRIRDYQGASIVLENHMKFATPARYIQLDPIRIPNQADKSEAYMKWDLCILEASEIFSNRQHCSFNDSSVHFVSMSLKIMKYNGTERWFMFRILLWMFFCGKYVGCCGVMKTWAFFIIYILIAILILLSFIYLYL